MDLEVCLPSGRYLSSLKVKDLQRELNKRRLSSAGKKAELLARLTEHVIKEYAAHTNSDPVSVSPLAVKDEALSKDGKLIRRTTVKRRSHSRLNETFEYVEDADSKEATLTVPKLTPEGKSIVQLTNASHRNSSRQGKDRHSRGDTEAVRPQTPKSSRNAHPSSDEDHSGFFTDDVVRTKPQALLIETGTDGVEVISVEQNIKEEQNNGQPSSMIPSPGQRSVLSANAAPTIFTISQPVTRTPESEVRLCGRFAAPTLASAARSTRKERLFPKTDNDTIIVTNTNEHQSSNYVKSKRTLLPKPKKDVLNVLPSSSRSIKKRDRGNATAQFARQHARLFEEMESIADQRERIVRLHEKHMLAAPNVVKRLATPKILRKPLCDDNAGKSTAKKTAYTFDASKAKTVVTENSFRFGNVDDFNPEQSENKSKPVTTSVRLKTTMGRDERDVKSRTKASSKQRKAPCFIGLTLPVNNSSLNLLATPKNMSQSKVRERTTYTPHRGAVGTFVDTTKLSDREYELAVANGLIRGRSRSSVRMDTTRKSRRDEILDVKRKLHI